MSYDLMPAAWTANVPPLHKLVLLCLTDFANSSGRAWPSIPTITERTGLHRSTVIRILNALHHAGLVTAERVSGRGTRYMLNADSYSQPVAESDQSQRATGSAQRQTRRRERPHPSQSATGPVAHSDPIPYVSLNEPLKPSRAHAREAVGLPDGATARAAALAEPVRTAKEKAVAIGNLRAIHGLIPASLRPPPAPATADPVPDEVRAELAQRPAIQIPTDDEDETRAQAASA